MSKHQHWAPKDPVTEWEENWIPLQKAKFRMAIQKLWNHVRTHTKRKDNGKQNTEDR